MERSLTILLLCLTLNLPSLIWASDEQPIDRSGQRWATLLAEPVAAPALLSNAQRSGQGIETTVTSTFVRIPPTSTRLRDLSPETDGPRVKGLVAKMSWLKGSLMTESEVANSYGGNDWWEHKIPGDNRVETSKQMVRLGVTGMTGALRYGLNYRKAGQAFLNAPDQGSREMWGEWRANWVTLRSVVGQLWNNVVEDASRPRQVQTYGRMSMGFTRASWPELSLTYGRNSFSSVLEPAGILPQRTQSHTLEGAVAYQSLRWNVRLSSTYALASDLLHGGAESNVRMQLLSASFRPLNTLMISPMLGYREEIQDASGMRIDGPSASLALHYKQSRRLLVSAIGNYANCRSNDGQIDNENVGGKGIVAWDVQQSTKWSTLIALEAGYTRVSNRVTPAADTEDISGLLRIVLAAL
jgi:hypothetical protein